MAEAEKKNDSSLSIEEQREMPEYAYNICLGSKVSFFEEVS